MIPPLPIFRHVVNRLRLNFDLPRGIVPLKITRIIHRIPKTPFNEAEELHTLRLRRTIPHPHIPNLTCPPQRHKMTSGDSNPTPLPGDLRISQSVPAFVTI